MVWTFRCGPSTPDSNVHRARLKSTSPEAEAAEDAWWARYAAVEEAFCWVQPAPIRYFLRSHYLRTIAEAIPPGARVLELGCGTGWLDLWLAERVDAQFLGLDRSEVQVERARAGSREAALGSRVEFLCADVSSPEVLEWLGRNGADVILIHGVLHHLSERELRELTDWLLDHVLTPSGRLILLEPVLYRSSAAEAPTSVMERLIDRLILLPRMGERSGLRRVTAAEACARELVDLRGDSPKETPFCPGELEAVLSPRVRIQERRPVLAFSFLAAKNLLLMELSYPKLARLIRWPYLWVVRSLERVMLKRRATGLRLPVMELMIALPGGPDAPAVAARFESGMANR